MGPDDKNRDARGWAKGAFCGREPQDGRCGSTGAPVKTLRNVRGRGVGPVACARGCSGLARLDTVYLIGPSILTCRHADMLDKGITGLFGTASERHILMEGVRGGSPLGHMPSGQPRGVSGGRRISCPGSAPPWLPCPSPSPGCRARRGALARCPGYPPDTPWCSGRGAWRGFAGTWR